MAYSLLDGLNLRVAPRAGAWVAMSISRILIYPSARRSSRRSVGCNPVSSLTRLGLRASLLAQERGLQCTYSSDG